jgi:hypothetical protein
MARPQKVSNAIQAALADINLLRPLVNAADATAALGILTAYNSSLSLNPLELQAFWKSVQYGMMTMDAGTLVDYYDSLRSKLEPERVSGGGKPQEWTP